MDFKPPVVIERMGRGNIANSVLNYSINFGFNLKFNELKKLLNCLKNKTHKDLEYFFGIEKKKPKKATAKAIKKKSYKEKKKWESK